MDAISQWLFQVHFLEWKYLNSNKNFTVPNVPVKNIPALAQIMAWRRPGDKPLSELMMIILVYSRIYASLGLSELSSLIAKKNMETQISIL